MAWDTAFAIAGTQVADAALLERAFVLPGSDGRMAGFTAKCRAGGTATVGFIGGSITEGAGASQPSRRYSSRFLGFLGKAWPRARFQEVNAGIGATGSRFGASRARYDLLDRGADLIVIEFAVNDALDDTAGSALAFEGLLRQCLLQGPAPVVVFQTMNRNGDSLNQGIQAGIAAHYGVPVVSYRQAFRPMIADGSMPWAAITADEIHPNDAGHAAAAYLLYAYARHEAGRAGSGAPKAIPPPFRSDIFVEADLLHKDDTVLAIEGSGGWARAEDSLGRVGFSSTTRGDSLALTTRARDMVICYRYAKGLDARISVRVDGGPADTVGNHFEADWGGGYLKPFKVPGVDGASRRVEIVNVSGGAFSLDYVLYAP